MPSTRNCFYYKARRRVQHAQILVVNHALFFTDLALREAGGGILPEYDAVIMDECHTVEAVASDHLGISIATSQIDYTLRKLYNPANEKGLLVVLGLKSVSEQCYRCQLLLDELISELVGWLEGKPDGNGRVHQPNIVKNQLSQPLSELASQLERYGKDQESPSVRQDMTSAQNRLITLATSFDAWLKQAQADSIYWIEKQYSRSRPRITMRCAPIDVGPTLRKMLFQKVPSVIMTSATLASGREGGFDFFQVRIGASGARTKQLGSPFNYREQAELILINDLPDPSSENKNLKLACPISSNITSA